MFEVFKIVEVNFKLRGGTEKKIKTKQKNKYRDNQLIADLSFPLVLSRSKMSPFACLYYCLEATSV